MRAPGLNGPASHYSPDDAARFLPEFHENRRRSSFARDRARLLHSSGLRRLALKTQVLSPTTGADFARNRLTHSLEVAQVGREIAGSLALDPDIVDTACLAHDIGHPPFGHNGERALNDWSADIGGFEGNAQTLRLVSRLEPKVFDDEGRACGLNLTRASLDAACKYPWDRETGLALGTRKFGVYEDDRPVFDWLRAGAPTGRKCIEAQVMDLSDDIAYSVHDLEDAVVEGFLPLPELEDAENREAILFNAVEWSGRKFGEDELGAAFDRLLALPWWVHDYSASARDRAALKNLTSQLIGRFAKASIEATLAAYGSESLLIRFGAEVIVPREIEAEIALLKGSVAGFVMSLPTRQPVYARQRELLTELLEALWATGTLHLEREFADLFDEADDDAARRRVIIDQVASLTDQSALALHANVATVGVASA
ncbi:deoxyguanosinetriphosphate triphosphohydrolase [Gulosibacter sp. ACHW.36C]|uniref:Deoxyguanosinetriphosphate triphosphohydrolase-like protein n=1 Tax=Gulosibacter sediminis TaxID=1729695 RepID=A0ABY4N139_9MICO|nr:deoxyguanosinetriphosphate triphosphohydrolase [Gulosibacter sediminis]UQN15979.1 deoxyguanosinetriphosphate triphosphohydrolase [Gulosibacter sediminis]